MSRESVGHTLKVAAVLCVVCSLLVSAAAVGLRPRQLQNKERERKKNFSERERSKYTLKSSRKPVSVYQ